VSLLPGSKLDRYTILEPLGEGGMGAVYIAHDPELDRRVALKVMHDERPGAGESHERFVREARLMAKLDHPNIVRVFDAGTVPGAAFIVMELVEGTSLESWLAEQLRPGSEILDKFLIAGYALAAAHSAGVIHRDFKPSNVLIDRRGRVAVADFGIAAMTVAEESSGPIGSQPTVRDSKLTQTGSILGTPAFMSPEQFGGKRADARTDQFSFAVALHEALFREEAFPGETIQELRAAVIMGTTRAISPEARARARAPAGVYEAILRALSRQPSDRFPTMLVMLRELERCISETGGARRPRAHSLLGIGGVGIVAVAVIGVIGVNARRSTASPSAAGDQPEEPAAVASRGSPGPLVSQELVGIGNKCLDGEAGALELRTCSGAATQRWRWEDGKLLQDGRCVGQHTGPRGVRTIVELQTCTGQPSQSWQLREGFLVSASGHCANVERGRTEDGTPIVLFECGRPNGRWHARPVTAPGAP
jgi:serine/threonine protein kinase